MKRIISVLLIAALVISLVPMSLAAETQVINLLGDGTLAVTDATFDTHGWQVNKTHTCGYLLDGKKWETATYFNKTSGIYLYFDTGDANAKTAAIDFKVNNDGWYDVIATIGAVIAGGGITYSGYMSVWIDGMLAGQIDTTTGTGDKRLRPMYLEEGTHTFFIALDGTGNTTRYVRCAMSAIKLNPITEDKAKPTSMEFLLSKDKISSGGEAEISATVTFGTGAKVNLYTESAKAKAYPGAQTSDDTVVIAATKQVGS